MMPVSPSTAAPVRQNQARPLVIAAVSGALALVSSVVLLMLAFQLRELLAVVLLGIVVGTVLGPLVDHLARYRIPRVFSGLLVYAVIAGLLTLFFWYAIPELVAEGEQLADRVDEFETDYSRFANEHDLPDSGEVIESVRERLTSAAPQVLTGARLLVSVILYTLTILAVGLFWTVTRKRAAALLLSLLAPRARPEADRVLGELGSRLRGFVIGEFAGMLVVGVITFISLSLLGMPFAFVLAIIAFLFEILPILGPWLAFVPALIVALTEGWQMAIAVSLLYLAVQQLESYVIVPTVHRFAGTHLPELIILIAVLFGGALLGILGALISIPVAIIAHTLFMEVFVPWRRERLAPGEAMIVEAAATEPPPEEPPH